MSIALFGGMDRLEKHYREEAESSESTAGFFYQV